MPEKPDHSIIVNIPRPREVILKSVCEEKKKEERKKVSEKAIRQTSEASLRKYTLPGKTSAQVVIFKDDLFLPYNLYSKKQDHMKRKLNLQIKLVEKYKIKNTDLRNRLHVEDPIDDIHAVTDVDDAYFRYLNCIPLPHYIPLYKSLENQFHTMIKMRIEEGHRRDCVLKLKQHHRKELQVYERSVHKYMEQVRQFDAFISEDYEKSMVCLEKSMVLVDNLNEKLSELQYLAHNLFTIQSRLIALDFMYYQQQKYGRFLYYLSPPSWRAKNRDFAHSIEIEAKGFDLGASSEEDTFNIIFEKLQNDCLSGLIKPALFFSQPNDLINILESIEMQQFLHFSHVTVLSQPQEIVNQMLKHLKTITEQDSAFLAGIIKDIEQKINFNEKRVVDLKAKFMKILYGMFFDSVVGTDVLKLQINLDFCYEKFFLDKLLGMNIKSTAKALEKLYMDYVFELDTNDTSIKEAMKQCNEDERKTMKRAQLAARELRMFKRLKRSLLRANTVQTNELRPSSPVNRPKTRKPKKLLPQPVPVVRSSSQRELTEAEIEYLTLFTDWTEKENPANYLQSLNISENVY